MVGKEEPNGTIEVYSGDTCKKQASHHFIVTVTANATATVAFLHSRP
jgi:hypothetical protein